jgi:putative spermidine/putrescine transport system permease protein
MAGDHGRLTAITVAPPRQQRSFPAITLLAGAPAAFLLIFFIVPTMLLMSSSLLPSEGGIVVGGLTLDNFTTLLRRKLYLAAILRTFVIGVSVGTLVVLLAYPLAYFLVRTTSRWKGALIALSLSPLLASVIVRTYGWYVILNREGALNQAGLSLGVIDQPLQFLPSSAAITVGLAHALLPYGVLSIMSSLNGLNPNLERAALSLGATRWNTFRAVTLPLTLPGVAGGFLLAFSLAISAYATPAILGGPATETMATMIRTFMTGLLDWGLGSAMGVILLATSVTLLVAMTAFGSRRAQV